MPCLETESTSWLKVIAASKLALPRYTNLYALIELQYSMQDQAMSKRVQICMPQTLTVFCGELDNVCRCTKLYATSRSYRVHSLGNTISCFRSASSCFFSQKLRHRMQSFCASGVQIQLCTCKRTGTANGPVTDGAMPIPCVHFY